MPLVQIAGATAFECGEDDTILRASLRAGLGFPYSCNAGSCGNCRFQLISGRVEHVGDAAPAWTDRDRKRGRWLGCCARVLEDAEIKVRMEAPLPYRPNRIRARAQDPRLLAHDFQEFVFTLDGPDRFLPGQYALLHLPGIDRARPYSMSNLPGSGEWQFQIKRLDGGAATTVLFDQLRRGDVIEIDGPYGHGYLRDEGEGDLLLIAGGSGLAPMISIARAATSTHHVSGRDVSFFLGGRQPHDLCAEPMLAALPGFGTSLSYVGAVSDPAPGWTGPTGLIHEVVRDALGERLLDMDVYFAGPPPMVRAMQLMLHDAGVVRDRIHFDEIF